MARGAMGEVKEHPVLFSGPMVAAILEGRKSVTRRVVTERSRVGYLHHEIAKAWVAGFTTTGGLGFNWAPRWSVGNRLWVKETWRPVLIVGDTATIAYRADGDEPNASTARDVRLDTKAIGQAWRFLARGHWAPSIHMPRWASRITLEVTGVSAQRLQDISEEDARAEGVFVGNDLDRTVYTDTSLHVTTVDAFRNLWDLINGDGAWEQNPWVWAVSFKVLSVASTGTGG